MPTTIKSTSTIAKLGDLSTYNISTSAAPVDVADTAGAVPTFNVTLAGGVDAEYQVGEKITLSGNAISSLSGEAVSLDKASNSARSSFSVNTFMERLNTTQRLYPGTTYTAPTNVGPAASVEYWSQQCGLFYDDIPGSVLYYQSFAGHPFAFTKGTTKPVKTKFYLAGGGTPTVYGTYNARRVVTFGADATAISTIPAGATQPVLIPSASSPNTMVFGSYVNSVGTGRKASITWAMVSPTLAKTAVRLTVDSTAGISMWVSEDGSSYTNIGTVAGAVAGMYHMMLGVTSTSSTQTRYTLTVLDSASATVGTVVSTRTSNVKGNLSLANITYAGDPGGSGSVLFHWGDYITLVPSIPTKLPTELKSITSGVKATQFSQGFSGNVWEHIKAYSAIMHLDVSFANNKMVIGPRVTATNSAPSLSDMTTKVSAREQARFVEVINLQSVPTLTSGLVTPLVMWKADSVYQVAVGEIQKFRVQSPNSILSVNQPIAVSGITPFPYKTGTGQYVVTGSDGYIVSPTFWNDQGGSVTVDTTENEGEIEVTIKGPDFDSARAPYRISEGDAGRPALYITGEGLVNTPVTLKVGTGNSKAAKEVGTTIDSPFITNAAVAYDVACATGRNFASPSYEVSLNEPLDYDTPSVLGTNPAGKLVKRKGNIFRLSSANQTPSGVSSQAFQFNTNLQVNKSFGFGATIGDQKAYYAGKTIGQVKIRPLKELK